MLRLAACSLVLAGALLPASSAARGETLQLKIESAGHDRPATPVRFDVWLPARLAEARLARLTDEDGHVSWGQLAAPGLLAPPRKPPAEGLVLRKLWLLAPPLGPREGLTLTAEILADAEGPAEQFAWTDEPGLHADLAFAGRPVLRYMYEALDESTPERRAETMKVYHHVYDPRGERLVTKGPGGLFPHHRGLFYGFNKISYGDGQGADVWHCNKGESQAHEAFVAQEAGPVLGRHTVQLAWRGRDGQPFARELRELTAYHTPGGTLIEFASRLTSLAGPVKLDGDPQHAGFQFRASQEVPDQTAKLTYYLRPDGPGQPGQFRNWPGQKEHANLPWNALSFVLGETRYTCCYLDRPENPKESRFSERDYGRFGSYFEYELDEGKPLDLNYRIWLQEGEMTVEGVQALSVNFTDPPVAQIEP